MCLIFLVTAAIIGAIVVKVTGVGDKAKDLPGSGDKSPPVRTPPLHSVHTRHARYCDVTVKKCAASATNHFP